MAYIVVSGCTVKASDTAATFKSATINPSTLDTNITINDNSVYKGTIVVAIVGYTDSKITNGDGKGSVTFTGSAKSLADGSMMILSTDKGTGVITGTTGSNPPVTVEAPAVSFEIDNAGQSDVESN